MAHLPASGWSKHGVTHTNLRTGQEDLGTSFSGQPRPQPKTSHLIGPSNDNSRLSSNCGAPQCIRSPQPNNPYSCFDPQTHKTWWTSGHRVRNRTHNGRISTRHWPDSGAADHQSLTDLIAITGGIVLLVFASVQLLQVSRRIELDSKKLRSFRDKRPGIVVGLVFTALNPFFIL